MSFSRRYAKHRSQPMDKPLEVEVEVEVKVEEEDVQVQEEHHVPPPPPEPHHLEPAPKPKRFARFLEKYQQKKEALPPLPPRKSGQLASRLNQAGHHHEPESTIHWRGIFWLLIIIAIIVAAVVGWRHRQQWLFPVKHIEISGNFSRVDRAELTNVLNQYGSGSLLLLSTTKLNQQLSHLAWVDQATVQRQWPTTLKINIQQQQAVARFGDKQLLNNEGVLFLPNDKKGTEGLPYIDGPENRVKQLWQAYLQLNQILAPYDLKILRLEVSPRLAYTLVLNNGITLYLGSNNIPDRLLVFAKVYAKSLQHRADQIQYADMRYNSGMAVGWKPGVNTKPVLKK